MQQPVQQLVQLREPTLAGLLGLQCSQTSPLPEGPPAL